MDKKSPAYHLPVQNRSANLLNEKSTLATLFTHWKWGGAQKAGQQFLVAAKSPSQKETILEVGYSHAIALPPQSSNGNGLLSVHVLGIFPDISILSILQMLTRMFQRPIYVSTQRKGIGPRCAKKQFQKEDKDALNKRT